MIARFRKLINPPYSLIDIFTILGVLFILLIIPVISLNVTLVREPASKASEQSPCGQYGDVDGDQSVTMADVLILSRHLGGLTIPITWTSEVEKRADVGGNRTADMSDALRIQRYISSFDITFPVCADPDGDSFSNATEEYLGTDPYDSCPDTTSHDAWPPDFNKDRVINVSDLGSFLAPIRRLDTKTGDSNFSSRWDINGDGAIKHDNNDLASSDLEAMRPYLRATCSNTTPKPTLDFTGNNSPSPTVNRGEQVTLRWSTTNAGSPCQASDGWGGLINNSGQKSLSSDNSATFTLLCGGSNGKIEKSVSVSVRPCYGNLTTAVEGRTSGDIEKNPGQGFIVDGTGLSSCLSSDRLILQDWGWSSSTWVNTGSFCTLDNRTSCSVNSSFQSGRHAIRLALDRDSNGSIEKESSNFLYINIVNQSPPPPAANCSGAPILYLSQRTVESGGGVKITATSKGFSNCGSDNTQFFWIRPVTRSYWVNSDYFAQCNFAAKPSECSVTFNQPNDVGRYLVAVTYELAGGGQLNDFEYLDVIAPPPPTPDPVSGGGSSDEIKNFIREYVGGVAVEKVIRTSWGSEETVNMGKFLWGLSGCETGGSWNPSAYAGPSYHEIGLFQYQHAYIPGYGDSTTAPGGSDVWGNAVRRTQQLGLSLGSDIFKYQDQVRVTEWKVKKGGGENVNAWSCYGHWKAAEYEAEW